MARAGETPQAQFKGLAYGENQDVNSQVLLDSSPPHDPNEDFQPSTPDEQFLYGPTDRPAEPLTAGSPFGPGADAPSIDVTPQQFIRNVVDTVPPESVDLEVAAFARRVAEGL